jgi:hypothetical protein
MILIIERQGGCMVTGEGTEILRKVFDQLKDEGRMISVIVPDDRGVDHYSHLSEADKAKVDRFHRRAMKYFAGVGNQADWFNLQFEESRRAILAEAEWPPPHRR